MNDLRRVGALAFAVVSGLSGCDEKSTQHAEKAKEATKEAVTQTGEALKESAKVAGEKMKEAAAKAGEAVGSAVEKSGAALKEKSEKLGEPKSEPAKTGGDALASARETMTGYIASLTEGNDLLESVKSPLDATTKSADIKSAVSSITSKASDLFKLSPEQQSSLKTEFQDSLQPLINNFKAHVDRLSKQPGVGAALGDVLKSVKLFE